jgi:hypothetical protein
MKRKIVAAIIVACVLTSCENGNDDSMCLPLDKGVCRIPYEVIFSSKESLIGRNVGMQGIASIEGDGIYFYPDVESKKYLVREKAVRIKSVNKEYLKSIGYLDGRRLAFMGSIEASEGNYWAGMILANEPHEVPLPVDVLPPAPPPPPDVEIP